MLVLPAIIAQDDRGEWRWGGDIARAGVVGGNEDIVFSIVMVMVATEFGRTTRADRCGVDTLPHDCALPASEERNDEREKDMGGSCTAQQQRDSVSAQSLAS